MAEKRELASFLTHLYKLAKCINYIKKTTGLYTDTDINSIMFLSQYRFDIPNLRILKYTRGGKPIVADDWVLNTYPNSETVNKAIVLSTLIAEDDCNESLITGTATRVTKDTIANLPMSLAILLGADLNRVRGKKFEDLAKQAGFEIVEVEAP